MNQENKQPLRPVSFRSLVDFSPLDFAKKAADTLMGVTRVEKAEAAPETPKGTYSLKNRGIDLDDEDIDELKHVLYGEVSNRGGNKRQLESRVIINTALNRIGQYAEKGRNLKLAEVLREPNQYQAYDGSQYRLSREGKGDPEKVAAIDAVLEELKSGKLEDNTNGAVFYIHNDDGSITYDDTRRLYK